MHFCGTIFDDEDSSSDEEPGGLASEAAVRLFREDMSDDSDTFSKCVDQNLSLIYECERLFVGVTCFMVSV